MATLLYLQASPRIERSYSSAVADVFVDEYAKAHPGATINKKNLFETDLMAFDGFALQAKYRVMHGEGATPEEQAAWADVTAMADEFKAADILVLATPMWNFLIPYRLKQYIDIICQPGLTFSVSPEGAYTGLVNNTKALCVFARGGAYPLGTAAEAFDHQSKYVQFILGFMGITDVTSLMIEPTLAGKETAEAAKEAAIVKAKEMAPGF